MTSRHPWRKRIALTALILLGQWASSAARAIERRVPDEYPTIQAAIDACVDGDQVVIEPNTYTGPGNCDLNLGGKAITVRSTDPNDPNVIAGTVIDCGGTEADPHRGFTFDAGEDPNSVVAGLTIANGYGPGEAIEALTLLVGGAIYCYDASPTITHCLFLDNLADDYGGGVYCRFAPATITDCTFSDNEGGVGGAIYCESSNATIAGCTFTGNLSLSYGGAICCYFYIPVISNCTFEGNASLASGGAVHFWDGAPVMSDCVMTGNASDLGGGIYVFSGGVYVGPPQMVAHPSVERCTIVDNSADSDGGGVYCHDTRAGVHNSTISNNTSGGNGGGIYASADGGPYWRWNPYWPPVACGPYLRSCVVSNNQAGADGGGMHYTSYAAPGLTLCTLSGNSAGGFGGGVFCDDATYLWVNSCVLWANSATLGPQFAVQRRSVASPPQLDVRFSDVQGGAAEVYIDPTCIGIDGPGNIDLDPLFVDPDGADDDPNTWQDNDYHLSAISMCNNRGAMDNDYAWRTDIDGEPRVADGRADMGADEFPNALPAYYYVLDLELRSILDGYVLVEPNEVPAVFPAGTVVTLTAVSVYRPFGFWKLYDPNHPGDGTYATTDANNPITILMDADRQVTAVFQCGGGVGPMPAILAALLVVCALASRRRRRV